MTEEKPNLAELLNMDYINRNNWSAEAVLKSTPKPQQKYHNVVKIRIYEVTLTTSHKIDIFYVALFDKKDSTQPIKRMYNHQPLSQEL